MGIAQGNDRLDSVVMQNPLEAGDAHLPAAVKNLVLHYAEGANV
jgi:hypothetical protein